MSQHLPTTSNRRTRRLSGRARAGVLGGTGLAAAVAAALLISGAAGASATGEHPSRTGAPTSMVEEGSGASDDTSGTVPASMVEEGSGASDATTANPDAGPFYNLDGTVDTTATTANTTVDITDQGSQNSPAGMVEEGSGASDDTSGAVPTNGVTVIDGDMHIAPVPLPAS